MSITKHKLSFDPAASDDYDVVKSYLSAADGTLITHTGSALDVNIKTSDITLAVDLTHTDDSVRLGDGTAFFTSTVENGDTSLDVHISNLTLAATQSGTWDIGTVTTLTGITNDVSIDDGGNSITVDALNFDIRDLTHASDSMKIGDGIDFMAVESDGSINVNAATAGLDSCAYSAKAVAITATDLVTVELSNRKSITLQNTGTKDIYIGCDASVTVANGLLVPKGATAEFPLGAGINVHAIADGAASEFRIMELA